LTNFPEISERCLFSVPLISSNREKFIFAGEVEEKTFYGKRSSNLPVLPFREYFQLYITSNNIVGRESSLTVR
jgi:hypothetical protein